MKHTLTATLISLMLWIGAAPSFAAKLSSVVPTGQATDVQQVVLSFAQNLVALGEQLPEKPPATLECSPRVADLGTMQQRWIDSRTFAFEFTKRLPPGVSCQVRLAEGHTSDRELRFDTGGLRSLWHLPGEYSTVTEHQVFLFGFNGPTTAAALERAVRCETSSGARSEIEVLGNAAALQALAQYGKSDYRAGQLARGEAHALRCVKPQDPGASLRIRFDRSLAVNGVQNRADELRVYPVRPLFTGALNCIELPGLDGKPACDTREAISVDFSAQLLRAQAQRLTLRLPDGRVLAPVLGPEQGAPRQLSSVRFQIPSPPPPSAQLQVPVDLTDADSRTLTNAAALSRSIALLKAPPYLGFLATSSRLALRPASVLPLAVRSLEPQLEVQSWRLDPKHPNAERAAIEAVMDAAQLLTEKDKTLAPASSHAAWLRQPPITLAPKSAELEVLGVPIKAGPTILQAQSPRYARYLGTFQDRLRDSWSGKPQTEALVTATNLNLHLRQGAHGSSLVWVTAVDSAKPLADVELAIYDCTRTLLKRGKTDAQGIWLITERLSSPRCPRTVNDLHRSSRFESTPLWLVGRSGEDLAVLRSTASNVGEENLDARPRIGHVILDRALFKAGETVHMQHVFRWLTEQGYRTPSAGSGRVEIGFSGGGDKVTLPLSIDASGNAVSSWKIPSNAKLGRYSATVYGTRGPIAYTSFEVAEFRTPVFDAQLSGAASWSDQQRVTLRGALSFLAGGAAAGAPVKLSSRYVPASTSPREGYSFEDPYLDLHALNREMPKGVTLEAKLDAQGKVERSLEVPSLRRPLSLQTEMSFVDPNGETQTVASASTVWPGSVKLGVRSISRGLGRPLELEVLALDADDKAVPGRLVSLHVQAAQYAPGSRGARALVGTARQLCSGKTDADGLLRCQWDRVAQDVPKHTSPALFLFAARGLDTREREVTGGMAISRWELGWLEDTTQLELANGFEHREGELLQIVAKPTRLPATLLLTIEREGVQSTQVQEITRMEQLVSMRVPGIAAPNAQVAARYVYPLEAISEAAPKLSSAQTAQIKVVPTRFLLKVELKPAKAQARPREQLGVSASVKAAQDGGAIAGARVSFVAVDEALLALRPNTSWQLSAAMLAAREIFIVPSWLDQSLAGEARLGERAEFIPNDEARRRRRGEAPQAQPMALGVARQAAPPPSPAAAPRAAMAEMAVSDSAKAKVGDSSASPRSNFDSLILWKTDAITDAQGVARAVLPLNDSLTRIKIIAIAQAGEDRFGEAETSVQVTQPLQIFSGLPQLLRGGDLITQSFTVRNSGRTSLSLNFTATGQVEGEGAGASGLRFEDKLELAAGQARTLSWPFAVPAKTSAVKWSASASGGGESDAIEIVQTVVPPIAQTVRQSTLLSIDGKKLVPIMQPAGSLPGFGGARISLQATLVDAALAEVRAYMRSYPYSCLEQQSSRYAVLDDRAAWDRLMQQIDTYLDAEGFARYFPESSMRGSEALTSYVLNIAHAMRWPVPDAARARMLEALKRVTTNRYQSLDWAPTAYLIERQLASQATLAIYGTKSVEVSPEDLNRLSANALADWLTYLLANREGNERRVEEAANQLRNRYNVQGTKLIWRDEANENWWWFMWSGDTAAARAALVSMQIAAGRDELARSFRDDAGRILNGLVGRQQSGRFSSTTGNAWSAVALRSFAQQFERGPVSGVTKAGFSGGVAQTLVWPKSQTVTVPWRAVAQREGLELSHEGTGAPWATVSVVAAVPVTKPVFNGLQVARSVSAVEQKVPGQWSVGDVMRVTLRMGAAAPNTWVVVNDAIPSGATLLGRGLGRESGFAQAGEQNRGWAWPSYIERATEAYRAFYRWVPRGEWSTEYSVRLNNAGEFKLPPVRIEAMYAQEVFGEAPGVSLSVRP